MIYRAATRLLIVHISPTTAAVSWSTYLTSVICLLRILASQIGCSLFFNNNVGLQRYNVMVIFLRPNDDSHSTCILTNRTFNVQRSSTFIRKHYFIFGLIFATHIRNVVLHCYLVIFLNFLSRQASSNLLNLRPSSEVKIC